jgi:hypothetical protein
MLNCRYNAYTNKGEAIMPTVYISLGKGKEEEGRFTTKERANADILVNKRYMAKVDEEEVSQQEFNDLKLYEEAEEQEAESWGEQTDLQAYRLIMKETGRKQR